MRHTTTDLQKQFAAQIVSIKGPHSEFSELAGFEDVNKDAMVFIQSAEQFHEFGEIQPSVVVTAESVAQEIGSEFSGTIVCVKDIRLAQALFKQKFFDYLAQDDEWPDIHPNAIIHSSSSIGNNCRIGPGVTIGANCTIADHVCIRANSVIEHGVTIGKNSIINSLANIGYNSEIGENVIIQSRCIIGNEGYGSPTDEPHQHHRIPHTGNVKIGNNVQIGSNTCVDRGTYASTEIERGVKIDNLCHIAHNVRIGENSLITAQTVIAGSSSIGKRVITSGQTGVLDHINIADDVVLVQRAGVSQDITESGMYAGSPAKPYREFVKGLGVSKKLARLEQKLKALQEEFLKSQH